MRRIGEQAVMRWRQAGAKRELEGLFRFGGWSKKEARAEVSQLAKRARKAQNDGAGFRFPPTREAGRMAQGHPRARPGD
jgi:hypothetical protein